MLMLQSIFPSERWAIVPQKYLASGKTLDLLLESFRAGVNTLFGTFIPKAYFEFKSPDNKTAQQAYDQAREALLNE